MTQPQTLLLAVTTLTPDILAARDAVNREHAPPPPLEKTPVPPA